MLILCWDLHGLWQFSLHKWISLFWLSNSFLFSALVGKEAEVVKNVKHWISKTTIQYNHNLNCCWVWHESDFAHHPIKTHKLYVSNISAFPYYPILSYVSVSIFNRCQQALWHLFWIICPGNICSGDNWPSSKRTEIIDLLLTKNSCKVSGTPYFTRPA